MRILLIEPFYSGSHKAWVDGLVSHSTHQFEILTLPGRHWKWRMHGSAVTLAHQATTRDTNYDLILASDMLDLAVFKGLTAQWSFDIPCAVYFHENQLTYPWSEHDDDVRLKRDNHYAFINYTSALCADHCFFNSAYHLSSFTGNLPAFLDQFPDKKNRETIHLIAEKSSVLHLGLDLNNMLSMSRLEVETSPILLWNHRWEYDKNPETFFRICQLLKASGVHFKLIVCGEQTNQHPEIFDHVRQTFDHEIIHWGFADSRQVYNDLLRQATVLPVTSYQDFFGGAVVEAIAAGCLPLLPDRLAYSEHLPPQLMGNFTYVSEEELVKKLDSTYLQELAKHRSTLRNYVQRYNWSTCIATYDRELEQVARANEQLTKN